MTTKEIQQIIATTLPPGRVLAAHTEDKHFYQVTDIDPNPIYPSVTGKLEVLKDPSIMNFKMNQALGYVRENYSRFTPANIEEQIAQAARMPADIFEDAGDVGSKIHDVRERYFRDWIIGGARPTKGISEYVPEEFGIKDPRIVSATRAIEKFTIDYDYEPVTTELKVYSHKLKVGGTLDDLGFMTIVSNKGDGQCGHDLMRKPNHIMELRCARCDYEARRDLALVDLKSSNRIKFHYAFQVAIYNAMLQEITGIKPDKFYILRVSKTDGTYELQEIKNMKRVASVSKSILEIDDCKSEIEESFKKPTFKI